MSSVRTNPAYATLAYRKAAIKASITYLQREYIGVDADPKQQLICEEVMPVDAEVPIEDIAEYVEELEREHRDLELEMGKFTFQKREDTDGKKQPRSSQKPRGSKRR